MTRLGVSSRRAGESAGRIETSADSCLIIYAATGGELALCGQESGGQRYLGAEDGPQEKLGISEQLVSATKHMTEVCQKGSYGIHVAKIIESVACSKFT